MRFKSILRRCVLPSVAKADVSVWLVIQLTLVIWVCDCCIRVSWSKDCMHSLMHLLSKNGMTLFSYPSAMLMFSFIYSLSWNCALMWLSIKIWCSCGWGCRQRKGKGNKSNNGFIKFNRQVKTWPVFVIYQITIQLYTYSIHVAMLLHCKKCSVLIVQKSVLYVTPKQLHAQFNVTFHDSHIEWWASTVQVLWDIYIS